MPYDTQQVDAAKIIGISSARMSQIHKQGMDKGTYRSKKGRRFYDMDKLTEALTRNLSTENQDRRGKKPGEKTVNKDRDEFDAEPPECLDTSFNEARRLNEWFKAKKSEIELEVMKGNLIPADEVKKDASEFGVMVKSMLVSIPERWAALLAAESDQAAIKKMLRGEVNQILTAIGTAR